MSKKITELTAISSVASGDKIPIVDVSDTSQAASGTTKHVTVSQLAAMSPSTSPGGNAKALQYNDTTFGGDAYWTRESAGRLHAAFKELRSNLDLIFTDLGGGSGTIEIDGGGNWTTEGWSTSDLATVRGCTNSGNNVTNAAITSIVGGVMTLSGVSFTSETVTTGTARVFTQGGYITYGLSADSFPASGALRFAFSSGSAPSQDVVAMKIAAGTEVPVIAVSNDALLIGGRLDDAQVGIDSSNVGVGRPIGNIITWASFWLQRVRVWKWQDDGNTTYETRYIDTIQTSDNTPTLIPNVSTYSDGNLRVDASHVSGSATWIFAGSKLVYNTNSGVGSAWAADRFGNFTGNSTGTTSAKALGGPQGLMYHPSSFRRRVSITQSSTANTTLTEAQYTCSILDFTGTPGGDFNVIAPNEAERCFIVKNRTANTLTFMKSGGTGVAVANGTARTVFHDGTDYTYGSG